jgi:hypothetical protein
VKFERDYKIAFFLVVIPDKWVFSRLKSHLITTISICIDIVSFVRVKEHDRNCD